MSRLEELIAELCPDGVEYKTIEEICEISRGRVISKDYIRDHEGEYPVYSSQTENDGILGKIDSYEYNGEYLTWTTDGANAGAVFYRLGKFNVTNVCGLLKIKNINISTKYVYYALGIAAPSYVNQGMGNPKLMSHMVSKIKIPVPPLPVQKEIVRILDNFAELTVELTVELSKRKQQYQYYRDFLLTFDKRGMTSQTDSINNIRWITIKNICTMKAGKHISSELINQTENETFCYKCFGGNGMRGYTSIVNNTGDCVLIGRQGALCGNVNFVSGNFYATEHAVVVKLNLNYMPKFLYYLLQFMNLNQYKSSGAQPGLSIKKLEKLSVPLLPLEEQARIVAILDRFDALCNDLTSGLPAEIEARKKQYEYYRDKLLTFKEAVQ